MTILKQMPTDWLEHRRDELLVRSREHMNKGEFEEFRRDCLRISKITAEMNRRDNMKREGWRQFV